MMMDDLVKRLREPCKAEHTYDPDKDEAAARIEALEAENADLKTSVVAFGAPWAVEYARARGLPDGHLIAGHYDILAKAGARMDSFTRAALSTAPVGEAKPPTSTT
jgi:hypothetical protein